jgi:CRISPR/Cas system CSM-associated protein Csm2 small subunit
MIYSNLMNSIIVQNPNLKVNKLASVRQLHLDTVILVNNNNISLILPSEKVKNNLDWQKHLPWIAAVFVGLLTVGGNIWMSSKLRSTSLEATRLQIESSTQISIAQISTAQRNSERDFNKTVLSGNRQVWITQLREMISQILASTASFIKRQGIMENEFEEIKLLIIKAELLLNDQSDRDLIKALLDLQEICRDVILKLQPVEKLENSISEIKKYTKLKIHREWEKVKAGV